MLLGGGFYVCGFVDGVELAPFYRVQEDFGGFLDTFEERVVFGGAGGSFFVRVVTEDFFAMSTLDLLGACAIAVFREPEDGVVVLALYSWERWLTD